MLYKFLRFFVRIVLDIYFRKITIVDKSNLPTNKSLLIASNHPSSFMEACTYACYLPVEIYFLTRGDVFESAFKQFLIKTNQIPIYRARDGIQSLRKNIKTFKWVNKLLSQGKRIVIFCEGTTQLVKRARPVQKGTARMAFDAMKDYPEIDLEILPMGINYHELPRFRSTGIIKIGNAINPAKYNQEDKNAKVKNLTAQIEKQLKPQIIHIEKPQDEDWIDTYLKIYHDFHLRNKTDWGLMFDKFQNLIDSLEKNSQHKTEAVEYANFCQRENFVIGPDFRSPFSSMKRIGSLLIHIFLLILAIPAIIFGTPLYIAIDRYARKKTKTIEFTIPVKVGLLFIVPFFLLTFLTIIFLFIDIKLWLIIIALLAISLKFYMIIIDYWNLNRNSLAMMFKSQNTKKEGLKRYEYMLDIINKNES